LKKDARLRHSYTIVDEVLAKYCAVQILEMVLSAEVMASSFAQKVDLAHLPQPDLWELRNLAEGDEIIINNLDWLKNALPAIEPLIEHDVIARLDAEARDAQVEHARHYAEPREKEEKRMAKLAEPQKVDKDRWLKMLVEKEAREEQELIERKRRRLEKEERRR